MLNPIVHKLIFTSFCNLSLILLPLLAATNPQVLWDQQPPSPIRSLASGQCLQDRPLEPKSHLPPQTVAMPLANLYTQRLPWQIQPSLLHRCPELTTASLCHLWQLKPELRHPSTTDSHCQPSFPAILLRRCHSLAHVESFPPRQLNDSIPPG